jgi:hypothetical protein
VAGLWTHAVCERSLHFAGRDAELRQRAQKRGKETVQLARRHIRRRQGAMLVGTPQKPSEVLVEPPQVAPGKNVVVRILGAALGRGGCSPSLVPLPCLLSTSSASYILGHLRLFYAEHRRNNLREVAKPLLEDDL